MAEFYQQLSQSSASTPYLTFLAQLTQTPLHKIVALQPFWGFWD